MLKRAARYDAFICYCSWNLKSYQLLEQPLLLSYSKCIYAKRKYFDIW